jgi:hypothetical protein
LFQRQAQGAVLDERRCEVGSGLRNSIVRHCRAEQRDEIVAVGWRVQAEAHRARIDSPQMQMPEIAKHRRAQADIEG